MSKKAFGVFFANGFQCIANRLCGVCSRKRAVLGEWLGLVPLGEANPEPNIKTSWAVVSRKQNDLNSRTCMELSSTPPASVDGPFRSCVRRVEHSHQHGVVQGRLVGVGSINCFLQMNAAASRVSDMRKHQEEKNRGTLT
jgi:hypothetical protein